jgi:hypothetical protein
MSTDAKDIVKVRLLLAALFMAARITSGSQPQRDELVKESVADADALLREVPL